MLTIKSGDLFSSFIPGMIIAHGCNNRGVMQSGFALQVKNRFPKAYLKYLGKYLAGGLVLGNVVWYYNDDLSIANCITQDSYGYNKKHCYVNYEAVQTSLEKVANVAKSKGLTVVMPFIGAGLGGGNPNHLLEIFKGVFSAVDAILWEI